MQNFIFYILKARLKNELIISASCEYGEELPVAVEYKNLFGVQFHPEKSFSQGLKVLNNLANLMATRPRQIVFLLMQKYAYKSCLFSNLKYVGDPINAIKIFNEFETDEIFIVDIDCTVNNKSPNFELLRLIAKTARIPIYYGGGITSVKQIKEILNFGLKK